MDNWPVIKDFTAAGIAEALQEIMDRATKASEPRYQESETLGMAVELGSLGSGIKFLLADLLARAEQEDLQ